VKATYRKFPPALALILVGFLASCGASPPPPTVVELTFAAAADVNPDPSGRASPIIVRYYQLGATGTFESADYFQIHDKEAALLGQDLLDRQELPLAPGATQKVTFEAKPGTKAVGVIASYRDIDHAAWRADTPIAASQTNKLKVQLDKLALAISKYRRSERREGSGR
jgi:type VI secretion system protein VasD